MADLDPDKKTIYVFVRTDDHGADYNPEQHKDRFTAKIGHLHGVPTRLNEAQEQDMVNSRRSSLKAEFKHAVTSRGGSHDMTLLDLLHKTEELERDPERNATSIKQINNATTALKNRILEAECQLPVSIEQDAKKPVPMQAHGG